MRIITLEEHVTTPELAKAAETARGGTLPPFLQQMQMKLLDMGEGRIADMDAAGIDMQVLSPLAAHTLDRLDPAVANGLTRDANDRMAAAVRAHPDRFAAFGTLALQEPEKAAAEFERCVLQLGFKGVMLYGAANGQFLDHQRFTPVLEAAQALDVPIYLHPAPPPQAVMDAYYGGLPGSLGFLLGTAGWGWHVETGMHCLRLMLAGVFDRLPKLKIIIGHMGENLPFSIARAELSFSRAPLGLKRTLSEYLREHFYLTTSGYFTTPPFVCMQQVVGIDRIMFSVDYPLSSNQMGREFLNQLDISAEDMDKITHRNAEKLLKI
jgi:uncharacterized protein